VLLEKGSRSESSIANQAFIARYLEVKTLEDQFGVGEDPPTLQAAHPDYSKFGPYGTIVFMTETYGNLVKSSNWPALNSTPAGHYTPGPTLIPTSHPRPSFSGAAPDSNSDTVVCFNCGENHFRSVCPHPKRHGGGGRGRGRRGSVRGGYDNDRKPMQDWKYVHPDDKNATVEHYGETFFFCLHCFCSVTNKSGIYNRSHTTKDHGSKKRHASITPAAPSPLPAPAPVPAPAPATAPPTPSGNISPVEDENDLHWDPEGIYCAEIEENDEDEITGVQSITVAQAPVPTRRIIAPRKLVNVGRSPTPGGIIHDSPPPSPPESEPSSDAKNDVIFREFFCCDKCGEPGIYANKCQCEGFFFITRADHVLELAREEDEDDTDEDDDKNFNSNIDITSYLPCYAEYFDCVDSTVPSPLSIDPSPEFLDAQGSIFNVPSPTSTTPCLIKQHSPSPASAMPLSPFLGMIKILSSLVLETTDIYYGPSMPPRQSFISGIQAFFFSLPVLSSLVFFACRFYIAAKLHSLKSFFNISFLFMSLVYVNSLHAIVSTCLAEPKALSHRDCRRRLKSPLSCFP
jgi:hypothetical protein